MPPFSRTGGEGLPLPESRSLFPYRAAAQNAAPACPLPHDTPQVPFPEHDHVIQAFAPEASNYSLGVRILPRTARRNDHFLDAECVHPLLKCQPIHSAGSSPWHGQTEAAAAPGSSSPFASTRSVTQASASTAALSFLYSSSPRRGRRLCSRSFMSISIGSTEDLMLPHPEVHRGGSRPVQRQPGYASGA
jgi:hypothetical protein